MTLTETQLILNELRALRVAFDQNAADTGHRLATLETLLKPEPPKPRSKRHLEMVGTR